MTKCVCVCVCVCQGSQEGSRKAEPQYSRVMCIGIFAKEARKEAGKQPSYSSSIFNCRHSQSRPAGISAVNVARTTRIRVSDTVFTESLSIPDFLPDKEKEEKEKKKKADTALSE